MPLNPYMNHKIRIEKLINIFNNQTNELLKSARQFSLDITRESEERVKCMLFLANEKVRNIEIKNISNKIVLKNKFIQFR